MVRGIAGGAARGCGKRARYLRQVARGRADCPAVCCPCRKRRSPCNYRAPSSGWGRIFPNPSSPRHHDVHAHSFELVATNRFVTVLHGSLLQFGNTPKHLCMVPIELSAGIPIGVIKAANRTVTPVVELFIERVRKIGRPMRSLNVQQLQRAMRNRSLSVSK